MANFFGTKNKDYISGTALDDYILGYEGDDVLAGGDGNDTIEGHAGDDKIYDYSGFNTIYAGAGNDTVFTKGGSNTIYGNDGNDYLYGYDGNDSIHGGNDNDIIRDILGYNDISGGTGMDRIEFSCSSHRVYGGGYGHGGDKTRDEFVLSSWHPNVDLTNVGQKGDVIGDFEVGIDVLNLAELGIHASQVTVGTYSNGYMINISTNEHKLSVGIRTGTVAFSRNDIIFAV